jgi:hypothetical protein
VHTGAFSLRGYQGRFFPRKGSFISLNSCRSIEDVAALGNVHKLDLSHCSLITDVPALRNVYSLKLQDFRGNDISGLVNVVILDISMSRLVSDITMLHRLETLNIADCAKIKDLSNLDRLTDLTCDFGMHIVEEKSLQNGTIFVPRFCSQKVNNGVPRSTFCQ